MVSVKGGIIKSEPVEEETRGPVMSYWTVVKVKGKEYEVKGDLISKLRSTNFTESDLRDVFAGRKVFGPDGNDLTPKEVNKLVHEMYVQACEAGKVDATSGAPVSVTTFFKQEIKLEEVEIKGKKS
ncbi:MAG TPA: hypothetical protein VI912_05265 [Candidatus Bilamarchaeaceae archaeon]|nr:hypothetical protein [Candidatus Bilamarchaeaceae archaeon]